MEQSYPSCLGVMALAKKSGGATRLEETCAKALAITPAPSYTLVKRLWTAWEPAPAAPPRSLGDAGFVRGADYYADPATDPGPDVERAAGQETGQVSAREQER